MLSIQSSCLWCDCHLNFAHINIKCYWVNVHVNWLGATVQDSIRHHDTCVGWDYDLISWTNLQSFEDGVQAHACGSKTERMSRVGDAGKLFLIDLNLLYILEVIRERVS